jgi:mevalonate kinase
MAEAITLKEIHKDLKALRKDVKEIKDYIEESGLELSDEAKDQINESRKRDIGEFLSQEEIEKKFL